MAYNIVKLENGNVALYDSVSGDFLKSISPDYVEIECNVNGVVKLIQDNGNVEYFLPADVANTQVLPAAAVPFAGTCADLAELLATDFFFEVTGGGVEYQYNKANYQNFGINPIAQALSSSAMVPNSMLFFAIIVKEDCTIERLRITISTGAAGNSVWGVYDAANGLPNQLLFQSTAFDNAITGTQEYILGTPYNIKKGIYFVSFNTSSSPTLRSVQAYTLPSVFGDSAIYNGPTVLAGYAYAYTGTMPATASAPTTYYSVSSAPLMPYVQFKIS